MSLPEASVRRPVTVLMITLAVAIFGWISMRKLPVELLPDLSYPTLTVQCEYPDAAPTSVEQFVTRPIEEAVGVTPGLLDMRSVSRATLSEVVLEFDWDEDMDFKAMQVREKLGLAELPREADAPRVLRFDPSLDPVIRLSFRGARPLDELRQVAERWLKPRLEAVPGVAAARVRGGLAPEVHVEADEDRLAALGLTLDDLATALRAENVNQPGGTVKDWGSLYLIRTLHEFDDLEQIRRTVVRESPEGRVRVEDIATVTRSHRDREEIVRDSGRESVEIALHREGSANTIAVATSVRLALADLREEMGDDLSISVLTDQSVYIADAISEVGWAAVWGGLLAVLVLYFFLRDLWATAIIAVTIPISVVATFLPMFKAGVSLNVMSLGGLALGIGMLVDNSIVVLEAIDRNKRKGLPRGEAAARGGREVAGAVTAATLTTVSVFLPIIFVGGVAGQLFYDLAVTVCLSLIASLLVSLTLIPTLEAVEFAATRTIPTSSVLHYALGRSGAPSASGRPSVRVLGLQFGTVGRTRGLWSILLTLPTLLLRLPWRVVLLVLAGILYAARWVLVGVLTVAGAVWWALAWSFHTLTLPLGRGLDRLGQAYPRGLAGALRWRRVILPGAFLLFGLFLAGAPLLGTNLVPDLSQGEFAFRLRLTEGTTLESAAEVVGQIEDSLLDDLRFERVFSVIGNLPSTASGRQTVGENLAQINFVLRDDLAETEAEAIRRVREVLSLFTSVEAELARPSVLTMRAPIAIDIYSESLEALDAAAAVVAEALDRVAGIRDVTTTSEPGNPEITIEIDRERAMALGVQADELGRSLRRQIRGEVVGEFREQEERMDIRLRASAVSRNRATNVETLRFRLDNGASVPVSSLARVEIGRGPAAIYRSSGARVAQVTAKVSSTDLGRVIDETRGAVADLTYQGNVVAELAGQNQEMNDSFDSLKLALSLAIFLVYVVMAVQFESLRYPFVILLTLPLGVIGVIGALYVTGTSINVLVLIGSVMLAGIVVNNAIVLVDAINRRRSEGEGLEAAILGAGRERLRPILMTTATTVLGLTPMALGLGAGVELRRPMAIAVIGGLSAATLLTLIVIPCLYRTMTTASPSEETIADAGLTGAEPVEGVTP